MWSNIDLYFVHFSNTMIEIVNMLNSTERNTWVTFRCRGGRSCWIYCSFLWFHTWPPAFICVCVLFWRWWCPCVPVKSAHNEPSWPSPLSLLIQTSCSPSLLFSLAPFVPPPLHLSLCLLSFVHKPRPRLKVKWTPTHPACLRWIIFIYRYIFYLK